jgi:hypothetical protein
MTDAEYLEAVLRDQTLAPDGPEIKELQSRREEVEKLLRDAFGDYRPTIRYGGSRAKGTMIKESYDLDVICYFPHDETGPGETLEDVYNNIERQLAKKYLTERKPSAIRLKSPARDGYGTDFHIDVVPGRYFDESKTDVWLYQNTSEKKRLKTNLDVHIEHVRDSGVTDAIRLMKLWRVRNNVNVKNFVLELLVVDLLKNHKRAALPKQLRQVLEQFRDDADGLSVTDPANPDGNDLSELLNDSVKSSLSSAARSTLAAVDDGGWVQVFGPVKEDDQTEALRRVAASVPATSRQKPWYSGDR